MKRSTSVLLLLSILLLGACRAVGAPGNPEAEPTTAVPIPNVVTEPTTSARPGTIDASDDLPMLPPLTGGNVNAPGDAPPEADDPFVTAHFSLNTELPDSPATAVVEHHAFGALEEGVARQLADQFGFDGPLYIQEIPPEFVAPAGAPVPVIYQAFDGRRVLNMSDNGVTYEDRAVIVNYDDRPTFAETAALAEAQLQEWGLLDFPYERRELPSGDLAIHRLIDGVPTNLNEFNLVINRDGAVRFFDYRPLRRVHALGHYPLISAQSAWQQLQDTAGRSGIRYDLMLPPVPANGDKPFVNPRAWAPQYNPARMAHFYGTPTVYRATDGSASRIQVGDLVLNHDASELAAIATHLTDVLHLWGNVDHYQGEATLTVTGWEVIDFTGFRTLEGTIKHAAGETLLTTADDKTFILPFAPADIPDALPVYVSYADQRETGVDYPVLDWDNITEKISWPDEPIIMPDEQSVAIQTVDIKAADLIYFTFHQTVDGPQMQTVMLFVPVWKFTGRTDLGHIATFWVPAVEPEYIQTTPQVITGPPPHLDILELGSDLVKETTIPVDDMWTIVPCEGEAPIFCITSGEEGQVGYAELLTMPLEDQPALRAFLEEAGIPAGLEPQSGALYENAAREALTAMAHHHLSLIEEDRAITYPQDTFTRLEVTPARMGGLTAVAFGFVHTDESGNVVERYLDIIAVDRHVFYWLGSNYDPANFSTFDSDASLLSYAPLMRELAAGLPIGR